MVRLEKRLINRSLWICCGRTPVEILMMVAEDCSSWALMVDMIAAIGAAKKIPAAYGGSTVIISVGIT